jgi:hypothetical protein
VLDVKAPVIALRSAAVSAAGGMDLGRKKNFGSVGHEMLLVTR